MPLLLRAGLSLLVVGCVVAGSMGAVLFAIARHANSLCFATAAVLGSGMLAWRIAAWRSGWRHPRRSATLASAALAIALASIAWWCSPTGAVPAGSRLSSVFRGDARPSHWSPAWLVDESDQVRLGGLLVQHVHPALRGPPGERFRRSFDAAYEDMAQSREFNDIGTTIGETYQDLLLPTRPVGHAYVYHPTAGAGVRSPVIVFLHGLLGNMKAYTWAWTRFADEHGFVIISPTFRNGVWSGSDADDTLAWLDRIIRLDPRCDPARVVVVGLSNGGSGASRWAERLPSTYAGLVMVSPVMDGTDRTGFASAVGRRPILVMYGSDDGLIPAAYVSTAVDRMRSNGLRVESICYDGEDHALILSSRNRLQADLLRWMQTNGLADGGVGAPAR